MQTVVLICRVAGALVLAHSVGLFIGGRRYPLLPIRWREHAGDAAIRLHGVLWLVPAGYLLAGPAALAALLHSSVAITMSVMSGVVLGWGIWAGLMAWSLLTLRAAPTVKR